MNRVIIVIFFLVIFILIEWYAFQAFKTVFSRSSQNFQQWIKIFYWSFSILVLLSFLFYHFGNPDWLGKHGRSFLLSFIFINYLFKTLLSVFVLVDDIFRGVKWLSWKLSPPEAEPVSEGSISRSRFLLSTGMIIAAAPVLSMSWGIFSGAHNYRLRRVKVPIANLPNSLKGMKILQLSDIHSGSFWDRGAVQKGVELITSEAADLILFTGDLVNNRATEMDQWKEVFGKINAPLGVYSILGNHDYGDYVNWESKAAKEENLKALQQVHADMGWQLLNNENRRLEYRGNEFNLIGVENWSDKGRFPSYGDLQKATETVDFDLPTILMSHDPSHWKAEVIREYPGIDLTLSGHTHGMQFGVEIPGFKWSPVQYVYDEWAGLYRDQKQHLYVNRGFGYIGYPGRFGILPEITVFELSTKG